MELPHLIVLYLFLEQFHTDYSKYTFMPRGSQQRGAGPTIAVNVGRPLSFCRKSKWNLTEKKITSCSFQWVDIILFSLGFFSSFFFATPAPRSTHCVSHIHVHSHSLVLGACVCVCVYFIIIFRAVRLEAPAFCRFFIYLFYAYAHTRQAVWQVSPTEWLPGWLADCLPPCPPPCLLWELMVVWVPVSPCRGCGWSATRCEVAWSNSGKGMKNVSLLFFVLFYAAFIRLFLLSFNRRGKVRQKQSNQQQQQHGGDSGYFTCLSRQPHPTRGHWEGNEVILAAQWQRMRLCLCLCLRVCWRFIIIQSVDK